MPKIGEDQFMSKLNELDELLKDVKTTREPRKGIFSFGKKTVIKIGSDNKGLKADRYASYMNKISQEFFKDIEGLSPENKAKAKEIFAGIAQRLKDSELQGVQKKPKQKNKKLASRFTMPSLIRQKMSTMMMGDLELLYKNKILTKERKKALGIAKVFIARLFATLAPFCSFRATHCQP